MLTRPEFKIGSCRGWINLRRMAAKILPRTEFSASRDAKRSKVWRSTWPPCNPRVEKEALVQTTAGEIAASLWPGRCRSYAHNGVCLDKLAVFFIKTLAKRILLNEAGWGKEDLLVASFPLRPHTPAK